MRTIFFTLSLLLPLSLFAQECSFTLRGNIVDETGAPLPGAAIRLVNSSRGTVSDVHGDFSLPLLCEGEYELHVQFMGFDEATHKVRVPHPGILQIRLSESSTLLETLIVEAQKTNVGESQTIQKMGGQTLIENRGKALGDVLKKLPGVTALQTGPTIFKPAIHGLHSNRILILNNGIRQEGQQWAVDHAPEIDPFIASELTVIKDAGAIKYGPDALGGVVLITPPELPSGNEIGGELNLVGMTNGRSGTVSGLLEGGFKDHWGWRIHGTGKRAGDFHAADYNLTNTGMREINFSSTLGYHKSDWGLEFYYSHFSTQLGILRGSTLGNEEDLEQALEREPPQYTKPFSYHISTPRQEADHDLIKINGHRHLGDNRTLRLQYGLQINNRKEFDVRRGSLNEIPSINLKLYTQTLDFEYEYTHRDDFYGSVGINGMMQNNQNIEGTLRIPFIPNYQGYLGGLFMVNRWHFARTVFETGLRYDQRHYDVAGRNYKNELYKTSFDFGNVSGTAGLGIPMGARLHYKTTLGFAWRPPHVAELYSFGRHQSVGAIEYGLLLSRTDNAILEPTDDNVHTEKSWKWIHTFSYRLRKFEAEATLFGDLILDYINLRPYGVTRTFTGSSPYFRYSQDDALYAGADMYGTYDFTNKFSIIGKASLIRAKDIEHDDYFLYIPANRFELESSYRIPAFKKLSAAYISADVRYTAHQRHAPRVVSVSDITDGSETIGPDSKNFDFVAPPPAYFLMDVKVGASRDFKRSKIDLRLEVNNLFNQAYREYTNRMRYFADDLGRNFTLALKYGF